MNQKLSETRIVTTLAEKIAQQLIRKVILYLRGRKDALLSGVDSGLKNSWDEVCVQVQGEQSVYWDGYDDTIRGLVKGYMSELLHYELEALWLQTTAGEEWNCKEVNGREPYPVLDDDIINYLTQLIYGKAADYENSRISSYLDKGDEG